MLNLVTDLLSRPFALIDHLAVMSRTIVVFTVLFLLVLVLRRPLYRIILFLGKTLVCLYCLISCYWLYDLSGENGRAKRVKSRNARTEHCESLYDRISSYETRKKKGCVRYLVLFTLLWAAVAVPTVIGEFLGTENYPIVTTITNLYHRLEAPVLHKARSRPFYGSDAASFDDVNPSSWNYDGIQFVCSRGIVQSKTGTFNPDQELTKQVLAVMLYQYAGEPSIQGTEQFMDISPELSTYPAMIWSVEQGFLSPSEDGSFGHSAKISYEQALTILHRYAEVSQLPVSTSEKTDLLSAAEAVSTWAQPSCIWAAENGMIIYAPDGQFYPKQNISKAMFSVLLYQFNCWACDILASA